MWDIITGQVFPLAFMNQGSGRKKENIATFSRSTVFTCSECLQSGGRRSGEIGHFKNDQALPFILILGFLISQARLLPLPMHIHCACIMGEMQKIQVQKCLFSLPHTNDNSLFCCPLGILTSGFGVLTGTRAGKALHSVDVPSISWQFCHKLYKKTLKRGLLATPC